MTCYRREQEVLGAVSYPHLHISDTQLSYVTDSEAGRGLLKMGGSLVPFINDIPKDTQLYQLMSTRPGEV